MNVVCIIAGTAIGSLLKRGIGEKYQEVLFTALGMCAVLLGTNAFVHNLPKSEYPVLFIIAMAIGSIIGVATRLERLKEIGKKKAQEKTKATALPLPTD